MRLEDLFLHGIAHMHSLGRRICVERKIYHTICANTENQDQPANLQSGQDVFHSLYKISNCTAVVYLHRCTGYFCFVAETGK